MDINFREEAPKLGPVPCVIRRVWSSEGLAGGRSAAAADDRWPGTRDSHGATTDAAPKWRPQYREATPPEAGPDSRPER